MTPSTRLVVTLAVALAAATCAVHGAEVEPLGDLAEAAVEGEEGEESEGVCKAELAMSAIADLEHDVLGRIQVAKIITCGG